MKRAAYTCLCLLLLVSCTQREHTGRDTIALVKSIAADSSSPDRVMLSSFSKPDPAGNIYIAGTSRQCHLIGQAMLESDTFDNVRARDFSDGLKDFSGETIALVDDSTYAPYSAFVAANGEDSMRELSVRMVLSFLRDKCNMSIYDIEGNASKLPAKLIVLADPWMERCGKFDVDTLFTLTSCKVPVISPQDLLIDAALTGEKKKFNVGLMCDSLYFGSGIYEAVFKDRAARHKIVGTKFFEAPSANSGERLLESFLDRYIESGRTEPLDVLLVDDWSADLGQMRSALENIRDFKKEESMRYGKYITPDFSIVSSSELTLSECYMLLRQLRLFTHKIAQPQLEQFQIKPQPGGDKMQFLLIPGKDV